MYTIINYSIMVGGRYGLHSFLYLLCSTIILCVPDQYFFFFVSFYLVKDYVKPVVIPLLFYGSFYAISLIVMAVYWCT